MAGIDYEAMTFEQLTELKKQYNTDDNRAPMKLQFAWARKKLQADSLAQQVREADQLAGVELPKSKFGLDD